MTRTVVQFPDRKNDTELRHELLALRGEWSKLIAHILDHDDAITDVLQSCLHDVEVLLDGDTIAASDAATLVDQHRPYLIALKDYIDARRTLVEALGVDTS